MTFQEVAANGAYVIVSLGGGSGIVLGLSRYFGKVWADRTLEKQKHEYAQLNIALTTQLGLINEERKHFLQLQAMEHQVKFSNLHQKRAEVIAELYRRLVEAFLAGKLFVSPFGGEPSKQAHALDARSKMRECNLFFELNRIYLPQPLCTSLEKFIADIGLLIMEFDMSLEPEDSDARKHKRKVWFKAYEAFDKDIAIARLALEAEFRTILGVNADATGNASSL